MLSGVKITLKDVQTLYNGWPMRWKRPFPAI